MEVLKANGQPWRSKKKKKAPKCKVLTYPKHEPDTVYAYADGSSNCKDRTGGWGVLLMFNEYTRELHGGKANSTNNEMELAGIYHALVAIKNTTYPIVISSDSQYAVNACTVWYRGWRRNNWLTGTGTPVKNVDLIIAITDKLEAMRAAGARITIKWVKGHAGHAHNEKADQLAGKGRKEHGKKNSQGAWHQD